MRSSRRRREQEIHYRAISLLLAVKPPDYRDVNADWVARKLDVTPEHLSRTFLKETGFHFQYFLEKFKIKWSVGLIRENKTLKVRKLAGIIGYNNVNHFIRLFRKHMGTTPCKFRQANKMRKNEKNIQNIDLN
jgi:YesN/AraC family two-component response regulator